MSSSIYDIPFLRIDGSKASLGDYRGKVLLLVNVASRCGLTPQYAGLEKLFKDKREEGLVIIGFPANDFGAQEPGSNEEISQFCKENGCKGWCSSLIFLIGRSNSKAPLA